MEGRREGAMDMLGGARECSTCACYRLYHCLYRLMNVGEEGGVRGNGMGRGEAFENMYV